MRIGSLCTGYGGLDLAVEEFFNAKTIWASDIDKSASLVIEQRFDVPNLGDLKVIDWSKVKPIDILTAGYPCQPFSHAGERKGLQDDRHIWPYIKKAISELRPKYVVLENVRGHLTLGFDIVLGDLAEIGYDARWTLVRASDVGAPHKRERLFVIAYANSHAHEESRRADSSLHGQASEIIDGSDRNEHGTCHSLTCDAYDQHQPHDRKVQELGRRFTPRHKMFMQAAPNALDQDGKLSAEFVEYMMGLSGGWITQLGLSRAQKLKMLGNGVVPQQAFYALELLTQAVDNLGDTPK
jgi:DNA (cytosine-5)-methyltransferase 1